MELNGAEVMDNPLINKKLLLFFFPSVILVPCPQTALDYRKYSSQRRIQPESSNSNISKYFSCSLRKQFPGEERIACFLPASHCEARGFLPASVEVRWASRGSVIRTDALGSGRGDTESLPVVAWLHMLVPEAAITFKPRSVIYNSSILGDIWPVCLSLLIGKTGNKTTWGMFESRTA